MSQDLPLNEAVIHPIPGFADPVSSLSHLAGAVLFFFMAFVLLRRGGLHRGRFTALLIFVVSSVFLFSMSGTYHLLEHGSEVRRVFQRLDHAAIFVLIAGTFTPPHALLARGFMRWGMLAIVWSSAFAGAFLKLFFFDDVPEWLSLTLYLAMGWFGAVSGVYFWMTRGRRILTLLGPIMLGAFSYTIGAVLEFFRWPVLWPGVVGPHELFHVAVILGALFHWIFVYRIVSHVELITPRHLADAISKAP